MRPRNNRTSMPRKSRALATCAIATTSGVGVAAAAWVVDACACVRERATGGIIAATVERSVSLLVERASSRDEDPVMKHQPPARPPRTGNTALTRGMRAGSHTAHDHTPHARSCMEQPTYGAVVARQHHAATTLIIAAAVGTATLRVAPKRHHPQQTTHSPQPHQHQHPHPTMPAT